MKNGCEPSEVLAADDFVPDLNHGDHGKTAALNDVVHEGWVLVNVALGVGKAFALEPHLDRSARGTGGSCINSNRWHNNLSWEYDPPYPWKEWGEGKSPGKT